MSGGRVMQEYRYPSDRPRESLRGGARRVCVELHGEVAEEEPAGGQDGEPVALEAHEPFVRELTEPLQRIVVQSERGEQRVRELERAEQTLDRRAAKPILLAEHVAPHHRQSAG